MTAKDMAERKILETFVEPGIYLSAKSETFSKYNPLDKFILYNWTQPLEMRERVSMQVWEVVAQMQIF